MNRDTLKVVGAVIGGLVGSTLAVWGIMGLWASVVVPLIPVNEYTGIIKMVVAVLCFFVFGGLGFWFVFLSATFCGVIVLSLVPNKKGR